MYRKAKYNQNGPDLGMYKYRHVHKIELVYHLWLFKFVNSKDSKVCDFVSQLLINKTGGVILFTLC